MKKKTEYLPENDYLSVDDYLNTERIEYLVVVRNPCKGTFFDPHKWSPVSFDYAGTEFEGIEEHRKIRKCSRCGEVQKRIYYVDTIVGSG